MPPGRTKIKQEVTRMAEDGVFNSALATGGATTNSATQTLTNKSLTSPTISGTVGGDPTFSGNPTFAATLATEAAAGITGGTGTIYQSSVERIGGIIRTTIIIDLTGLDSVSTDGDIIGTGASAAHLGQITAARNGTIFGGRMYCMETPATGEIDFDVYSADEATGVLDDAISGLSNTVKVFDRAGDWAANDILQAGASVPGADDYLYLTVGTASTPAAGTYTAGKFVIELFGYDAA